jgi:hypothetical protein
MTHDIYCGLSRIFCIRKQHNTTACVCYVLAIISLWNRCSLVDEMMVRARSKKHKVACSSQNPAASPPGTKKKLCLRCGHCTHVIFSCNGRYTRGRTSLKSILWDILSFIYVSSLYTYNISISHKTYRCRYIIFVKKNCTFYHLLPIHPNKIMKIQNLCWQDFKSRTIFFQ